MKVLITRANGETSLVDVDYFPLEQSFANGQVIKAEVRDTLRRIFHDKPVPLQKFMSDTPIEVSQDQFKAMVKLFDSVDVATQFIYMMVHITRESARDIAQEILDW